MDVDVRVDTSLEIFAAVQEAFDEDKECEHAQHSAPTQQAYHAGKAEWYIQTECSACGRVSQLLPICDKWVQAADARQATKCKACREILPVVYKVKERIK